MNMAYVALEIYIPTKGYLEFSKLNHVKEIITLDDMLCPNLIKELTEEDWKHLYRKRRSAVLDKLDGSLSKEKQSLEVSKRQVVECYFGMFVNLDWLLNKINHIEDKQVLAVSKEPIEDCVKINFDNRFKFYGYDLMDDDCCTSALTNCGGFDEIFSVNDISEYGLIKDFSKARLIQRLLKEKYPYESHANCTLWAIWRMDGRLYKQ